MTAKKIWNSARFLLPLLVLPLFSQSCSEEVQRSLRPTPTAFGKLSQLIIIADQEIWDGNVGDTLRHYYATAFPILPQPEPLFDLTHFTAEELMAEPMRRELRNYMFVANLGEEASPTGNLIRQDIGEEKIRQFREDKSSSNSVSGRDNWARGQLRRNFPSVTKRIQEAEKPKIDATVFLDGESYRLKEEVKNKIGVDMRVPGDYILALSNDNTVWMRKETSTASSNIMVHKMRYTDQSQLSRNGIKAMRDSLGRLVSSTTPNTYMRINDIDLPLIINERNIDGHYALEARGIWEIVNDYMGGAFVSYLIHNPKENTLVFVDGFVHAPGEYKRPYILYLDHILNTVKL
jgi:hypothetical protein